MPDFPNGLTFFTVNRTVHTSGVLTADVMFEAQIPSSTLLQGTFPAGVDEILAMPVLARIVNGVLVDTNGSPGVKLLSAQGVEVIGGFMWLATFNNVKVNGIPRTNGLEPVVFPASLDGGSFDLKDAASIPRSTTGLPAWALAGGTISVGSREVTFRNADGSYLSPISIPDGYVVMIDNGDGTWSVG